MTARFLSEEYNAWLLTLKEQIRQRQIKAALSVNAELILLYWEMGRQIAEKQKSSDWGSGFINRLSADLKKEFPGMTGFSRTNLFAMKKFHSFYQNMPEIIPRTGGQLTETSEKSKSGWGTIGNSSGISTLLPDTMEAQCSDYRET